MKKLEELILSHLDDADAVFVFPTGVAARQWAEHILEILPDGCGSVAMDKFIAWDQFKGESIKSQHMDETSIPSVMRKMFASTFIAQNAEAEKPLFTSLVPPEYRTSAGNFTDWISNLLPQLQYWAEHRAPKGILPSDADDEDHDLLTLYTAYRDFLTGHHLFDPAWEKPPFHGAEGEHYYVLYPNALQDFDDYRELLTAEATKDTVTLVFREELEDDDKDSDQAQTVYSYTNSRTELRLLALQLRKEHAENNTPWGDMAISIPDTDTYGPYLTRELELYDIPYQYRIGKPLSSRGAGLLFSQLQACVADSFSYDSLKDLLTNPALPWKESGKAAVTQLISFGQKNCCICSYEKDGKVIDPWMQAFDSISASQEELRAKDLYQSLRQSTANLVKATTFADIKKYYFAFKERFFEDGGFTADDDRILGRCISELASLIEVETSYPDVTLPDPFAFFCQVLDDTTYVPQAQEKRGVHIYEYKAAASAPFAHHYILDASQNALQVTFNRLLFLRSAKRSALSIEEIDASREYISMYGQNSRFPAHFSCAEKTFGDYSIPHSSFIVYGENLPKDQRSALLDQELTLWNAEDPYLAEKQWYLNRETAMAHTTRLQAAGFASWKKQQPEASPIPDDRSDVADGLKERILNRYCSSGNFRISKSSTQYYLDCPRKWFYERIIKVKEASLDAGLLDDSWYGEQLHRVMELFFSYFTEKEPLQKWNDTYTERLETAIDTMYSEVAADQDICQMSKELIYGQRTAVIKVLHENIPYLTDKFPGYTVYGTEQEYVYTPVLPDGTSAAYELYGKIDLLLLDPSGENLTMIDYKSWSVPTLTGCTVNADGKLENLQFAMYKLLLEKGTKPDGNADNQELKVAMPYFFNLTAATFMPNKKPLVLTEKEEAKVLEYADLFASDLQKGQYQAHNPVTWSTCSQCKFKRLCRTSFRIHAGTRPVCDELDPFFFGVN